MTSSSSSSSFWELLAWSLNCFPAAWMSSRNGREVPKDCVLVSECTACAAVPSQEKRHFQMTDKYFNITIEAESPAHPGHIKHLHSCAFGHLAVGITGITEPHLPGAHCVALLPNHHLREDWQPGKVVQRWFPSGLQHSRDDFSPWSAECWGHCSEGIGHHSTEVRVWQTDTKPEWNAKLWPKALFEFRLVFHALLLVLVQFKGLHFCLTM